MASTTFRPVGCGYGAGEGGGYGDGYGDGDGDGYGYGTINNSQRIRKPAIKHGIKSDE